jgi:uncharacterized Zn-finger protein
MGSYKEASDFVESSVAKCNLQFRCPFCQSPAVVSKYVGGKHEGTHHNILDAPNEVLEAFDKKKVTCSVCETKYTLQCKTILEAKAILELT